MPLVSFSAGQVISSANVNANFGLCVLTDTSRTVSVTHTWSSIQTFSGGWTAGAGCTISTGGLTVSASGITVTGNSTVTGSLAGLTTLGLSGQITSTQDGLILSRTGASTGIQYMQMANTSGGVACGVEGSAGGSLIVGSTAYDAALRGKSGIAFSANDGVALHLRLTSAGSLVFGTASSKIIPGATSFSHRNNADSADNLLITDAGVVTVRSNLVLATAASKVIPGATSVTFRNNADTQNNLQIVDAGDVTIGRGNLTLSLGNFIITGVAGTVQIGGNQVVGPRLVGYTNAWTGAAANLATGYDASTITLPQLAARVRALQESITTHGLIGV